MTAAESALAYVEGSEYRKEAARRIARRVIAEITVQDLIAQGKTYTDDLLDALMAALWPEIIAEAARDAADHARALGLTPPTDATSTVTVAALAPVLTEAITLLEARIEELSRSIGRMADGGASPETIGKIVKSDAGAGALIAPVVSILVATAAGSVSAVEGKIIEAAARFTSDQAQADGGEPPLFEWETREDDRVCDDVFENSCAPRHGRQLTIEEWDVFGQPQGETLICTIYSKGAFSNCRCVLREADAFGSSPSPINITDAAKRGRERAAAAFPEAA